MDSEIYSFALKNTLSEIVNLCPDVKNSFIFTEDGEIIAGDEKTPEKTIVKAVDAFDAITEKAEAIGGIDNIKLETSQGSVDILHMNNLYLVTVSSKDADKKYVSTVTKVLIPTVLKLLEKISPTPQKPVKTVLETKPETPSFLEDEEPAQEKVAPAAPVELKMPSREVAEVETVLPEPQASQFIIENIGGLLVPSDTVRIDNETLLQWQSLYDDRRIEEVEIETFGGQSIVCKVKPIKDSKFEGKGIIQVPERIQNILEVKKGELVRVKPKIY